MLSSKTTTTIEAISSCTVLTMFSEFCNTKFRGSTFSWEKFPELVAGLVKVQIFTANLKGSEKEIAEYAYKTAKYYAENAVNNAGFIKENNNK